MQFDHGKETFECNIRSLQPVVPKLITKYTHVRRVPIVTNKRQSRKAVPATLEKTVIAINIHVVNAISLTKRVNPKAFSVSTTEKFC